jgi:hypothetical protein
MGQVNVNGVSSVMVETFVHLCKRQVGWYYSLLLNRWFVLLLYFDYRLNKLPNRRIPFSRFGPSTEVALPALLTRLDTLPRKVLLGAGGGP